MARTTRRYDIDYKIQSVKLAEEIGLNKAAKEIGIPVNTLNGWIKVAREDRLNLGLGFQTPSSAMSLTEELNMLRKQ
ncbi:MAG: transposase, partial [Clostridium sp.]|nr:transposase [Clostridium sp.]